MTAGESVFDTIEPVQGVKKPKLKKKFYEEELAHLQEELVKLQSYIKAEGLKVVVIFEGRDAAGKGGAIKRITEKLSPRVCRVEALGTPTERFDRFDEGLEIIRSLLDNELTTFLGEHFTITDARCEPKPVQDRLPIVIGGKGPRRTLRAVARWADQWDMAFPESPGEWERLDQVLQQHCADVGRDHAEITRSVHFRYNTDDDPAALVDHAAPFFDAGVDVVVWTMGSPISPQRVEALAASL